jgi:translation initiation factor IF-2
MKKDYDKEEFKKLIKKFKEEKDKLQKMDDEEVMQYNMEKTMLREAFRNEEIKHFPIMIKASTAGALETLIKETERVIYGVYRINIIDASVGPLSEADITAAA